MRFSFPSSMNDGKLADVSVTNHDGLFPPSLRERFQPKCELPQSTKNVPSMPTRGLLMYEYHLGSTDEIVMLQLIESQCVSILTYAIEVIHVADRDQRRKLRVAYNSIFRRIFGYRTWESVTNLQHALHRPTWEELIDRRTAKFMISAAKCPILNNP